MKIILKLTLKNLKLLKEKWLKKRLLDKKVAVHLNIISIYGVNLYLLLNDQLTSND